MIIRKHILSLFLILITGYVWSQNSNLEIKKIKLNALELAIRYESVCGIGNDDQKDDFLNLFENLDVQILNDILPENKLESKVAVKNYIDILPAYFTYALKIGFRPYEVNVSDLKNNEREVVVFGLKSISGRENKSQVTYIDTLDIYLKIKYNSIANTYKIIDIGLNQEPTKYLILETYQKTFFRSKLLVNDTIVINKLLVPTTDLGKIFIKGLKENTNIIISPYSDNFTI